jgi:rhamnosyltransferase
VGAFREDLFIDNIDLEWCYRARSLGMASFGSLQARLHHRLGDRCMRLGGLEVAVHSPQRLHYIMRNRLLLYRMPHIGMAWKLNDVPRMVAKFIIFATLVRPQLDNAKAMLLGVRDGLLGRSGRLPS